jgi:hypothetical protein
MNGKALYTVEPYQANQHRSHTGAIVHVDANGPLEAGEQVLGERLAMTGSEERLRCRVWRLDEQYRPISVLLYARG